MIQLLARLVFLLGWMPTRSRRRVASLIGWILGSIPNRESEICRLQLQAFLGSQHPHALTRRVFRSTALTFLESLRLEPILEAQPSRIRFDDWQSFESWIRSPGGKVCLTGHVGNWDLLAAYMQRRGVEFHALGRPARGAFAQHLLEQLRSRYGVRTIWRSDQSGVRSIVKELKEGRGIAALIDQDTNVASRMVPFFGTPAKTPSGLVDIAKRLNATFCSLFLVREESGTFRIVWRMLDGASEPQDILLEFHCHLEAIIKAHPDQWVWFHKRWRTGPDGSTLGSTAYIKHLRALLR